jgi:hypothetical protein
MREGLIVGGSVPTRPRQSLAAPLFVAICAAVMPAAETAAQVTASFHDAFGSHAPRGGWLGRAVSQASWTLLRVAIATGIPIANVSTRQLTLLTAFAMRSA